jgi:hypothetical protein
MDRAVDILDNEHALGYAAYFIVGRSFRHYKVRSRCKTAGGEGNPAKLYRVMWYVIVGFTISQPLRFKVEIIK